MRPPLGLRPPGALMRAPQVADFYSAHWPDFAPPLTQMSERLNTTDTTAESVEWQPAGDVILQVEQGEGSVVEIQCRAHADAPWVTAKSVGAGDDRIVKLSYVPWMKVAARNPNGGQVRIWDSE